MKGLLKILLLGGTGLLGSEIKSLLELKGHDVVDPSHRLLDVSNIELLNQFFDDNKSFDWCINSTAYARVDLAEKETEEANLLNGTVPGHLAQLCSSNNVRFLHLSTDYVFNGEKRDLYTEEDSVDPINVYGKSKLNGEIAVLQSNPDAIIARTSLLFGIKKPSFFQALIENIHEQESFDAVDDIYACPTFAPDLAKRLIEMMEKDIPGGIYHVTGTECLSRYEIGIIAHKLYLENFRNKPFEVVPISAESWKVPARRPKYTGLSNEKLNSIGISKAEPFEKNLLLYMHQLLGAPVI